MKAGGSGSGDWVAVLRLSPGITRAPHLRLSEAIMLLRSASGPAIGFGPEPGPSTTMPSGHSRDGSVGLDMRHSRCATYPRPCLGSKRRRGGLAAVSPRARDQSLRYHGGYAEICNLRVLQSAR